MLSVPQSAAYLALVAAVEDTNFSIAMKSVLKECYNCDCLCASFEVLLSDSIPSTRPQANDNARKSIHKGSDGMIR